MDTLSRILLVFLYPLLLVARVLNALRGCDRVRLRPIAPTVSCWIERSRELGSASYFSEASSAEGHPQASAAQLITHVLRAASRLYVPTLQRTGATSTTVADRHQNIPDEVYTLW